MIFSNDRRGNQKKTAKSELCLHFLSESKVCEFLRANRPAMTNLLKRRIERVSAREKIKREKSSQQRGGEEMGKRAEEGSGRRCYERGEETHDSSFAYCTTDPRRDMPVTKQCEHRQKRKGGRARDLKSYAGSKTDSIFQCKKRSRKAPKLAPKL